MKAMMITDFGSTDVFKIAELEKPIAKSGHVVIKVSATSVNPVDYKIRDLGNALPFAPQLPAVLGMDFAGTIVEVGDEVKEYQIGDEVYGCAGGLADLQGSLAEYMLADAKLIALKPKNITMTEAAALPLVAITAYEGLMRAGVSVGKNVLIHGGSGGVGHVAVQLAKYLGASVYATGGGEQQLRLIEQLGATAINYKTESVSDYVQEHTNGTGFDIIFDTVGEMNLVNSMEAASLNAHIATTVSMVELDLTLAHIKGLSLHVVFMLLPMLSNIGREVHSEILSEVTKVIEAGGLKPVLTDKQFSLSETAQAHAYAESGQGIGKVVINITN